MPVIQPDLTQMVDLSPIEAGTYPAKITEVKVEKSKGDAAKGKAPVLMIIPKFAVKVGDTERTRTSYLPIEGAGTYGFDQLLRACHMEDLADQYKDPGQPNPDFDTDSLIGQELMVTVDEEIYTKQDASGNPVGTPEKRDRIKNFLKA